VLWSDKQQSTAAQTSLLRLYFDKRRKSAGFNPWFRVQVAASIFGQSRLISKSLKKVIFINNNPQVCWNNNLINSRILLEEGLATAKIDRGTIEISTLYTPLPKHESIFGSSNWGDGFNNLSKVLEKRSLLVFLYHNSTSSTICLTALKDATIIKSPSCTSAHERCA